MVHIATYRFNIGCKYKLGLDLEGSILVRNRSGGPEGQVQTVCGGQSVGGERLLSKVGISSEKVVDSE